MFSRVPFYHQTIRKAVIAFGKIFSEVYVVNKQNISGGVTKKIVRVPLVYGEKEKWFVRLKEDPELKKEISTTFPRMTFEVVGIRYDATRKLNHTNRVTNYFDADSKSYSNFSPAPYSIDMRMYVGARSIDDGLHIIEQILPFFSPAVTVSINSIPELGITQDVPITLLSVNLFDSYDGAFQEKRQLIYTLDFEMKLNLHPNLKGFKDPDNHFSDDNVDYGEKRIKIVNTDLENQNERITVAVNPKTAEKNDDYTIDEIFGEIPPEDRSVL